MASLLAVVEGVERHDELEGGDAWRKLDEDGDVIQRAADDGELSMVDNVLGGVGTQSVVERDAVKSLGTGSEICGE